MRKIYYFTPEFGDAPNAAAIRSKFHVESLIALGVPLEVLSAGGFSTNVIDGVTTFKPGLAPSSSGLAKRLFLEIWLGLRIAAYLCSRPSGFDVVVSTPPFVVAVLVTMAAKFRSAKLIVDVRDRYPQVYFSLGLLKSGSLPGRVLRWIERKMYAQSSLVVTVTSALAKRIEVETGCPVRVIRNGFDEELFIPRPENVPIEHRGDGVRIVMHGLFGRLFDQAGFLALVDACRDLPVPHEFILMGYGPALDNIARRNPPNVTCLPPQPQRAVAEILRSADIGLSLHSEQESSISGFAVKVYEFWGCGLPVLITPVNEAGREALQFGMGSSFSSAAMPEAAFLLRHWITSRDARERVREAVMDRRTSYSRQSQAKEFAGLVVQALAAE